MNRRHRKILVIDDEKPTLKLFRLLLDAMGYDILTAGDGQEGLEVFTRERPEIILTDIKMPIMDGIEVLKNIKRLNPHAEVVVITGHGDLDLAVQSLNLDATDFINKPVNRAALKKALARAEERLAISERMESQVIASTEDGVARVDIRGNVSALTVPTLREAFAKARASGSGSLRVVFQGSTSINGAGITALADELLQCRNQGMDAVLSGLSSNFESVFSMVGITKLASLSTEGQ
jgi:anti-anti-sigma factor